MADRALVGNVADVKQVKQAKKTERLLALREQADLEHVLNTESGRRFVWRLLCRAGVFQTSFRQGQADYTAFLEGRREFGLMLMADITALNPDLYHRMAKEAKDLDEHPSPVPPADPKPVDTELEETES